jgi:hypothetical protein
MAQAPASPSGAFEPSSLMVRLANFLAATVDSVVASVRTSSAGRVVFWRGFPTVIVLSALRLSPAFV